MKTDITRTIVTTTIRVAGIKVDGNGKVETPELAPIVNVGTTSVKIDKAEKIAKATYPDEQIVIIGLNVRNEIRGMDIETFMKYSTHVERPESQRKQKN